MTLLPLNTRIEAIERAHPEILIAAPWATRSGRWQVNAPGFDETYANGTAMVDDLEKRFPAKPGHLGTTRGDLGRNAAHPKGTPET